jgi:myo-inositol 2-dehydrogenase / D-chiro-inositol 1-dehydrogenase
MTVRIGLIGAGVMGTDHALIIGQQLHGAELAVVCDADAARAKSAASQAGCLRTESDPLAVIASKAVDAVLIASPDHTHGPLTLACLDAGKPVLCEKPLSQSSAECQAIVGREVKSGRRLVQVGFMRRFDPSYIEMRKALVAGTIGRAMLLHCVHRNVSAPEWFTGQMAITNSAPHEFDIARFLLGEELVAVTAFQPAMERAKGGVAPVFMVCETAAGQLVNIEVNNNASYGYDVRGEIVGEEGAVAMAAPAHSTLDLRLNHSVAYAADWRPRFAEAYRLQNQAWVNGISAGHAAGASAWDGLCATLVAEAAVQSLEAGKRIDIRIPARPAVYGST